MRKPALGLFAILALAMMACAADSTPASAQHVYRRAEPLRIYRSSDLYRLRSIHRPRRPEQIPQWPCGPGPMGDYCREWYAQHRRR
jgi:hypothetical protein